MWLSLVERVVRDDEAAGSNPVTPTPWQGRRKPEDQRVSGFFMHRPVQRKYATEVAHGPRGE